MNESCPPRSPVTQADVILVGAGPIGIEMAVALKTAGIDYIHLEARQFGHTISWFPRYARFFSSPERIAICGVPLMTTDQSKATREEYLNYLSAVVRQFDLSIRAYEPVLRIDRQEGQFEVETSRAGARGYYRAARVILTIGDMHRPRPLEHPGFGSVAGTELPHVSSYFVEPHPYISQRLLIVGGRNSAVEAAIRCHRAGAQVALSYRRPELDPSVKYWLRPELEWLIKTGEIAFFGETVPTRITSQTVTLARCDAAGSPRIDEADLTQVAADFVLLLIGYQMDRSLLEMAGVRLLPPTGRPDLNPETNETNVPGIYIAGTAVAGSQQRYKLFIENCHSHVVRILRHLTSRDPRHVNPLAYTRFHEQPFIEES